MATTPNEKPTTAYFVASPEKKSAKAQEDTHLCTVLHGYGRLPATEVHYIDDYKFVGGVGRNVPKNVAMAWAKGIRWQDSKPALSRVYIQAVLPADCEMEEVEFAKVTGIQPMEPAKLAAMITATDATALVEAMGRTAATALAEKLLKSTSQI